MRDKGYAHPLYSLDLLAAAALPEDEARYFVPAPAGRLVVRREQGVCPPVLGREAGRDRALLEGELELASPEEPRQESAGERGDHQ